MDIQPNEIQRPNKTELDIENLDNNMVNIQSNLQR